MGLKQDTSVKHKMAERMPFNIKMFKGELSNTQYGEYLKSQLHIFKTIEDNFTLPHSDLRRTESVLSDLSELGIVELETNLHSVIKYGDYLKSLNQDSINAHIYLHYLALTYGGRIMKTKTPGSGKMYEFSDVELVSRSIRYIQKDEWSDEVNIGFDYMIGILDELDSI